MKLHSSFNKREYLGDIFSDVKSYLKEDQFAKFCSAIITLTNHSDCSEKSAFIEIETYEDLNCLKERIKEFSKNLFFYQQKTYLYKECQGFHKLSFNFYKFKRKKNAIRESNHFLEKAVNNNLIKSVNCKIENIGSISQFGPYYYKIQSSVTYIDNCHLCTCPTKKIPSIQKISILRIFDDIQETFDSNNLEEEIFWQKIAFLLTKQK